MKDFVENNTSVLIFKFFSTIKTKRGTNDFDKIALSVTHDLQKRGTEECDILLL